MTKTEPISLVLVGLAAGYNTSSPAYKSYEAQGAMCLCSFVMTPVKIITTMMYVNQFNLYGLNKMVGIL